MRDVCDGFVLVGHTPRTAEAQAPRAANRRSTGDPALDVYVVGSRPSTEIRMSLVRGSGAAEAEPRARAATMTER
jgi:hypothetical protein